MKFLIASLLFINILVAQTLSVGDKYPSFMMPDQFNKYTKVYHHDEMVIMTFEKDISAQLSEYLQKRKSDYLPSKKTKYVADISGMPSIITKMFALPKMKKYNYKIQLIHDGDRGEQFPRKDEMITVFKINNYKIESIEYMKPKEVIDLLDKR